MVLRRVHERLNQADALRKSAVEMRGKDEKSASLLLEEVERRLKEATELLQAELRRASVAEQ